MVATDALSHRTAVEIFCVLVLQGAGTEADQQQGCVSGVC